MKKSVKIGVCSALIIGALALDGAFKIDAHGLHLNSEKPALASVEQWSDKMDDFGNRMDEFGAKMDQVGEQLEAKVSAQMSFADKMEAFGDEIDAHFGN